jgi:hypothetical protein
MKNQELKSGLVKEELCKACWVYSICVIKVKELGPANCPCSQCLIKVVCHAQCQERKDYWYKTCRTTDLTGI